MTKNYEILKAKIRKARMSNDEREIQNAIRFSIEKGISNKKLRNLLSGGMI